MTTLELIERFIECVEQQPFIFPHEVYREIIKRLGKYDRLINFLQDNNHCTKQTAGKP